jgi:hypothetical protein
MTRYSYDQQVVFAFIKDDRLVSIPARHKKRLVILRYLIERCFPDDRAYPEKEVNQRLALFHPDVAALRRYMVEEGLLTRGAGDYRRVEAVGEPQTEPAAEPPTEPPTEPI